MFENFDWNLFWDGGINLFFLVILALTVWSLVWKGLALYKAARRQSKGWFVALLLINTLGILDILYLYIFNKKSKR